MFYMSPNETIGASSAKEAREIVKLALAIFSIIAGPAFLGGLLWLIVALITSFLLAVVLNELLVKLFEDLLIRLGGRGNLAFAIFMAAALSVGVAYGLDDTAIRPQNRPAADDFATQSLALIGTPTAEWQNSVTAVEMFYQQINSANSHDELAIAWDMQTEGYQISGSGTKEGFLIFWSRNRVGYHIFGCDRNEVEVYLVFFDREDIGYDFPKIGSERKLHIYLLLTKDGYKINSAEDVSQITCELMNIVYPLDLPYVE
jgi:hypothetical protein